MEGIRVVGPDYSLSFGEPVLGGVCEAKGGYCGMSHVSGGGMGRGGTIVCQSLHTE